MEVSHCYTIEVQRHELTHAGLRLSYLDAGGSGRPLIALHAHWMEGKTWAPLAEALAPAWRVIAPDQRGHGDSDHALSYSRGDYLGDLDALISKLGLRDMVLLGNSLGGVNAYQYAARHPVRGLIVEDIGAVLNDNQDFVLAWKGTFPTQAALEEKIGPRLAPYLRESMRETAGGWTLAFSPDDMVKSQTALNGEHWRDWTASRCPALLVRGADSRLTEHHHFEEMVRRRPNTELVELPGGHTVHVDAPGPFTEAVRAFLKTLA